MLSFPAHQRLHCRYQLADHLLVHGVFTAEGVDHVVTRGVGRVDGTGTDHLGQDGAPAHRSGKGGIALEGGQEPCELAQREGLAQQRRHHLDDQAAVLAGQGEDQVLAVEDALFELSSGEAVGVAVEDAHEACDLRVDLPAHKCSGAGTRDLELTRRQRLEGTLEQPLNHGGAADVAGAHGKDPKRRIGGHGLYSWRLRRSARRTGLLGSVPGGGCITGAHEPSAPATCENSRMARFEAPELGRARTFIGFLLALLLPPLLEGATLAAGSDFLASDVLVQLAGVVAVALVGGLWPALLAALWSSLILNYFSTEPFGSLEIADPQNVLTLLIFVAVGIAVSLVVGLAARRSREAAIASADAATLGELARGVLAAEDTEQGFLHHVRTHFGMEGAALFTRDDASSSEAGSWELLALEGGSPASSQPVEQPSYEGDAATVIPGGLKLVLYGRPLTSREQRLLAAFGSQLAALRQRQQLVASTEENRRLAEGNVMRTAILRAVSHDLRTPLASIKLASNSLRQQGITFTPEEEAELLGTIETSSDRLASLIDNLLDMSRLTGDAVTPHLGPVHWSDVLAAALKGLPSDNVRILLAPNTPPVHADFGMLERVVANIAENALKYAGESDVEITATVSGTIGDHPASEMRVRDHGRGVEPAAVVRMFQPFQRLDDTRTTGLGLGLAVARGFTEVMGGELRAEETPGSGLTMVVRLPLSTGVAE